MEGREPREPERRAGAPGRGAPIRGGGVRPAIRPPAFGHGPIARVATAIRDPEQPSLPVRPSIGLPNLRRNVCPHFFMTGARGAIPIQAPHLLKALVRQDRNISRCQLRGGVHLEQGYVNDVCLSPRFNQCVFYEDDLTGD